MANRETNDHFNDIKVVMSAPSPWQGRPIASPSRLILPPINKQGHFGHEHGCKPRMHIEIARPGSWDRQVVLSRSPCDSIGRVSVKSGLMSAG
jgi:hypothetical protein